eukprot:COSAG01_NODE_12979_length_1654_cov_1.932476_1_plen_166_part_00
MPPLLLVVAATFFAVAADRAVAVAPRPHIIQVVADDLGYDDLGHASVMGNGGKTITPAINQLMEDGIILHDYYTFKVCSPTRASLLTGRYPWGAGFYDMSDDGDHCTSQFKLIAALLKVRSSPQPHVDCCEGGREGAPPMGVERLLGCLRMWVQEANYSTHALGK